MHDGGAILGISVGSGGYLFGHALQIFMGKVKH